MANRQVEILIQPTGESYYEITVDDDLVEAIRNLEGVASISGKLYDGMRCLWIDKRYNADDVLADIQALADSD